MSSVRGWIARFSSVFNRNKADCEMEQEFQVHLQMQIDDNVRAGMTPEEARRVALLNSGSIAAAREAHCDQRGHEIFAREVSSYRRRLFGLGKPESHPGGLSSLPLCLAGERQPQRAVAVGPGVADGSHVLFRARCKRTARTRIYSR
jgi:hypothetical protein